MEMSCFELYFSVLFWSILICYSVSFPVIYCPKMIYTVLRGDTQHLHNTAIHIHLSINEIPNLLVFRNTREFAFHIQKFSSASLNKSLVFVLLSEHNLAWFISFVSFGFVNLRISGFVQLSVSSRLITSVLRIPPA